MRILGIAGRDHDAAAALAIDGQLVAAAEEQSFTRLKHVGYGHTDGFPTRAAAACLARAGVSPDQIDELVVVDEGAWRPSGGDEEAWPFDDNERHAGLRATLASKPSRPVDPIAADAGEAAAVAPGDPSVIMVVGGSPGSCRAFRSSAEGPTALGPIAGADQLICFLKRVVRVVGCSANGSFDGFAHLAAAGEPDQADRFAAAVTLGSAGLVVNEDQLARTLIDLVGADAGQLKNAATLNALIQSKRTMLAASALTCVARAVGAAAVQLAERSGVGRVGFGGSLFSSARVNATIRHALGDAMFVSPVPEPVGRAVGAALDSGAMGGSVSSLGLGAEFDEADIKLALDGCRLDYLYEPSWARLLRRVSGLLAGGKTVAWFQGPMEFGPRALGHRSVLCDPSSRYARENVNRFLKGRSEHCQLAVSMSAATASECLEAPLASPFASFEANVRPQWRDRLRSALDYRAAILVHTLPPGSDSPFAELLRIHRERTGVPGVINTTLSGADEPTACTPRDAIRTTFSSAIDALVIGRFLLLKDYWLLRSESEIAA